MGGILAPKGDSNFPYWPGLGIQNQNLIPGQQMAGEVVDIPLNKSMYMLHYLINDIQRIPSPEALQDKKNASLFIEGQPVLGRGSGIGLTDMLLTSIAQTQAQGQTEIPK